MASEGARDSTAVRHERAQSPLPSLTAVVNHFPAPSQTFIRRKVEGLRDAGVDVHVAAAAFGSDADDIGVPLIGTAPWQHPSELRASRGRQEWRSLAAAVVQSGRGGLRRRLVTAPLRSLQTDIVHFEFSGIAVTYLDALDDLRTRSHLAVSCRGAAEQIEPLRDPRRGAALAEVFSKVDLIHCVSDDMRRTVEALGAPPERILVNRPAVPVHEFSSLRRAAPDESGTLLRVLSIGRLHWKKGLDDGLRAMAALRQQGVDVAYRIVGEGSEREKLTFLIDQLDLNREVQLLGVRNQEQVRDELAAADVLLLPSLSEGISNAALEAMAAGRAVVSTDCGGMSEIIHDGENGFVVAIGDVAAMADRLRQLDDDPALRQRLGVAAAATADQDLDLSHQIARFVTAYAGLGRR